MTKDDFSEYENFDLDEHGLFGYGDLDYFWFEPTHAAYLVTVDTKLVGFVLVDNEVVIEGNERSICEFFVLRKYRRSGIGSTVARRIFDELPGRWEVRVVEANKPAQAFWRKVITAYTEGQFEETVRASAEWTGPVFSFDNRALAL
jgi:predicted acetyltransferase